MNRKKITRQEKKDAKDINEQFTELKKANMYMKI